MCCQDAPTPPDYGPMAASSMEVAKLQQSTAMEQLKFAKDRWEEQKALLDETVGVQTDIMKTTFAQGQQDRARYEQQYLPFETSLQEEARDYATPERRELEAGRAMADVGAAFDAQRRQAQQKLESYGIDPSQTRYAALDVAMGTNEAAAKAGAATAARDRVEQTSRALRADVINIGRGMPSNIAQSYGQSVGAGGAAQQGFNAGVQTGMSGYTAAQQGLAQAGQGFANAANINNLGFQNRMDAANFSANQTMGYMGMGLGAAGAVAGAWAEGGPVDGPGGPKDDAIHARLSDGEYVVPAAVVRRLGEAHFDKIIAKHGLPEEQAKAKRRLGIAES